MGTKKKEWNSKVFEGKACELNSSSSVEKNALMPILI